MNGSMHILSMTAYPCDHAFPEIVCSYCQILSLFCMCMGTCSCIVRGMPTSVNLGTEVLHANLSSICMTWCLMLSCLTLSCFCADESLKILFLSSKQIQTRAALTPLIKFCPVAVLWGYFAYMALDSLPGNQFWQRILLLGTDKSLYYK